MKFLRRPDLDTVTRAHIAAQAFLRLGVYGEITRIAQASRVSRLFVYKLVWQLRLLYDLAEADLRTPEAMRIEVDRHILLLRLEGHCALERMSHILQQLGLPFASVGYISQRLTAYARALPQEEWTGAQIVFLVCEEIFTRGQPILLTVEPRSLAIVKIELAANREATTWKQHWDALAEAGLLEQQTVVSDQGAGLVKGCTLMGLTHQPDLFHLLRPLARCGERLYRKALAAIAREYERGALTVGRSDAVLAKRVAAYEAAKAEADAQIRRYDNFWYLWTALRQTLELCDAQGDLPPLTSRQEEIAAILQLLETVPCPHLPQALASFTAGLEGYWGYYQRAEQVYQAYSTRYPRDVVQALVLAWQLRRQATNSKLYGVRKRLEHDAADYFASAAACVPEADDERLQEMADALEAEVRSSSLVENVHSTLRPLLETCRGQGDQPLLDLFAYVHNHRRFGRGKRADKAPIELLTGKELDQTWLPSLLAML